MPRAMILAAGLGTRLLPHTAKLPKALVPLAGKPLIAHVLDRFRHYNIMDVVVNLHHYGELLEAYLGSAQYSDFNFSFSDESNQLLDTGGGIRKAAYFFSDGRPFLVHNCDVISQIPLDELFQFHISNMAMATLAVSRRPTSRPLAFDKNGFLQERWDNERCSHSEPMAFSGIYILDPAIFSFMPGHGVFSVIDMLISAAKTSKVLAFEHSPDIWADTGTFSNFEKAAQLLKNSHL